MSAQTVPLRHSQRYGRAPLVGTPLPQMRVEVLLHLRRRTPLPPIDALGEMPVRRRPRVTREEFDDRYGASPDDLALAEKTMAALGLQVMSVDRGRRLVRVAGPAAAVERSFGVQFGWYIRGGSVVLSHVGSVSIPAELDGIVEAVHGLDLRPIAAPQVRLLQVDPMSSSERLLQHAGYRLVASQLASTAMWQQALDHQGVNADLSTVHANAARHRDLLAAAGPGVYAGATASIAAGTRAAEDAIMRRYTLSTIARQDDLIRQLFAAYVTSLGLKTPPQAAELYRYPSHVDGTGECIGVLQFGGGFEMSSVFTYFALLGAKTPSITVVPVGGATNQPGVNDLYDTEVALDIEIAGGAAPGAALAVYFAPLTEMGFIEAFATAIHDKVNRPSVLSVSWALAESEFIGSPLFVSELNELFKEAALLGVTICIASGDQGCHGSTVGAPSTVGVDFPGSSPYVLACGGTQLASLWGRTLSEVVWNDPLVGAGASGGGISALFPPPAYQSGVTLPPSIVPGQGPGRGVPDVSANADPITGYYVLVNGRPAIAGGTSSAAPLWAALIARFNQGLGAPCGYLNPLLYRRASSLFRDITVGDNGGYQATPGWDACTGFGSPDGTALLEFLGGVG